MPRRPLTSRPRSMRRPLHGRRGLTLIEMLIALTLFVAVFGLAVPFFRVEARSVSATAGRLEALQSARFAQNAIDREIRMAGAGVIDRQPMLVQADPFAVTFNADLVTTDANDPSAVYLDFDTDSAAAVSMDISSPVTLPLSAKQYPESNYVANGLPSRAETVQYWVTPDSSAAGPNLYVLYRRVNDRPPRLVAKGIFIPSGQAFFTYYRPDTTGHLDSIRTASLPLYHVAIHGAPNDTGKSAWLDSIRVVHLEITGQYHDPSKGDVQRTVRSSIKLLNAGMLQRTVCGDPPTPPTAVGASSTGGKATVTWTAASDQDNGEKDVERYMVFRKLVASADWGEPIASVQATLPNYSLDDTDVKVGDQWMYAVVAQDCSPANSSVVASPAVTIAP